MNESEQKAKSIADQKKRIRERYKGIDTDALDVIPAIPQEDFYRAESDKRVAVYARVSTDDPRQTSSYELQKNHYEDVVSRNPHWMLVEIYADEGISGTSLQHRDEFVRMINDCKAGKIDLIVTKSVSRFARNVLDCIGYVRQLKAMTPPIGVFFETENIYTLNENSEMSLSFISTLAQEESHTKSEIMNASIEMRFKRGIFLTPPLLGYDQDEEGNLVINEDEAKIVRLIFFMYLYGYNCQLIADTLTKLGIKTKRGNDVWSSGTIYQILQNERHCGDVLARKTWTPNYLDHKSKKNRQNRNQYHLKDHHEPIISRDDFIAVQQLIRNARYKNKGFLPQLSVITEGVLKGYVPINPRWASFTETDYYEASAYAFDGVAIIPSAPNEVKVNPGEIDLRGFEVARTQFFTNKDRICVCITGKSLSFSTAAVRRFPKNTIVELLLQPGEKMLAVRPATPEVKNHIVWSNESNGKTKPRVISGAAFLPTIFTILGWERECKYRVVGHFKEHEGASMLLFDLKEAEMMIPSRLLEHEETGIPLSMLGSKKSVVAYPEVWKEGFGDGYYKQRNPTEDVIDTWAIDIVGTPVKNPGINITDTETLEGEINKIISEMESTNG